MTIQDIKKGTPEARKLIRRSAERTAKRPEEVDDFEQIGWIAVLSNLHKYDPSRGRLDSWVWAVAKEGMLESVKPRGPKDWREKGGVEAWTVPAREDYTSKTDEDCVSGPFAVPETLPLQEQKLLVQEILAALTPYQRKIARLYHLTGLTQEEIAAKLGVSQQAISRTLSRIRNRVVEITSHTA